MQTIAPFGFVTGCHPGDKFMVQATLASIRHYCPEVPICLVADGDVKVEDLEKEYRAIILRTRDLPNPQMRDICLGNPMAKMAAMWEGPFERFVWMDSDAIVWGDFTPWVRADVDFQIFWNEVSLPANAKEVPAWMPHYYFDPIKIQILDPEFEWRGLPYFCNGVYGSRRNALPFQRWRKILEWQKTPLGPWASAFSDMPLMNYMVHSMQRKGSLQVAMTDLQHIGDHHGTRELKQDCAECGWQLPDHIKRPRVLHFCGKKPYLHNRRGYSRPFTIARLEHHRRRHGEIGAWLELLKEEAKVIGSKVLSKLHSSAKPVKCK